MSLRLIAKREKITTLGFLKEAELNILLPCHRNRVHRSRAHARTHSDELIVNNVVHGNP